MKEPKLPYLEYKYLCSDGIWRHCNSEAIEYMKTLKFNGRKLTYFKVQ